MKHFHRSFLQAGENEDESDQQAFQPRRFNRSTLKNFFFCFVFLATSGSFYAIYKYLYCEERLTEVIDGFSDSLTELTTFFNQHHFFATRLLQTRITEDIDITVSGTPLTVTLNSSLAQLVGAADSALLESVSEELITRLANLTESANRIVGSHKLERLCEIDSLNSAVASTALCFAAMGFVYYMFKLCGEIKQSMGRRSTFSPR